MHWTKQSIYQVELNRAYVEGFSGVEAERIARKAAEAVYWSMVDQGREQAKDREVRDADYPY